MRGFMRRTERVIYRLLRLVSKASTRVTIRVP